MKTANQRSELRDAIALRLDALRAASASSAEDRRPVELDQPSVGRLSRMDAMQMQAMAMATERARSREIERLQATLARIDNGDYGYCVACGEAIAPKRLEADPAVPTCIRCASAER